MEKEKSLKGISSGYFRIVHYFAPELKKFHWLIMGASVLLVVEVLFRLLEPWPLKFIFDAIILGPESNTNIQTLILFSAGAILVFSIFRAISAYGHTIGFALAGNRVMTKIRNDLYDHIQCLPLEYHNKSRIGDLIVRVVGDMGLLQEVTVTALMPLLGNLLIMFGMFAVMLWMNWILALVALCILPLFLLTNLKLGGSIQQASKKQRRTESQMATTAAEAFSGIRTVQALSLEDKMSAQFASSSQRSLKEGVQIKRLSARLERIVDVLVAIALALVVGLGANLVLNNSISPGDLIVFITYLKAAYKPIRNFAKYTARLSKAIAAGDRIIELFEVTPNSNINDGLNKSFTIEGDIRFQDVDFAYNDNSCAINHISFEIKKGESVSIVGPSGSGKSTLVSLLLRLYQPNSGNILYDNLPLSDLDVKSLRRQVSVVLQDTLLFATTIGENITFGEDKDCSEEEIIQACKMANIYSFVQSLPEGFESLVGERGVNLSTGQKQRLALARAVIRKSPIIILDEPTNGLDTENVRSFNEALFNIPNKPTIILVTHDLEQAKRCQRIMVMQDANLVENGSHEDLMKSKGVYRSLYEAQKAQIHAQ